MVNIKEVAARAGVSPSTVSRALSGKVTVNLETRQRVLAAVQELNYKPNVLAQGLKEGRSKTIGLFIPNIRILVFPAAIKGITDVAEKHGYTVVLCNTDENLETERFYVDNLCRRLVDGLIFSTATAASSHIIKLKEQGYPIVLLIRYLNDEIDTIMVDNFKGGFEATEFLLNRGYRRIAMVNGTMELDLYRQRFAGYQAALREYGVEYDEGLVVHGTRAWEEGYRAMHEIWRRGRRPEAVFGASDPKALGVMKAVKERGLRVPEDVAVIGYDNLEMSELSDPPLTTMAQPFYEAGARAAERLIELMDGERGDREAAIERLPPKLHIRRSVGCPRKADTV
ncbi:MAG: LacI family DNA-binding transcriptional regulator [Bacteroidota bacterium]